MKNPFQYLRDEVERQKVKSELKKEETIKQHQREVDKRLSDDRKISHPYNKMVIKVLKYLQTIAYPYLELRGWSIGKEIRRSESVGFPPNDHEINVRYEWDDVVRVSLMFDDSSNLPIGFSCTRSYESINCGLSEKELVEALINLHPSDLLLK